MKDIYVALNDLIEAINDEMTMLEEMRRDNHDVNKDNVKKAVPPIVLTVKTGNHKYPHRDVSCGGCNKRVYTHHIYCWNCGVKIDWENPKPYNP